VRLEPANLNANDEARDGAVGTIGNELPRPESWNEVGFVASDSVSGTSIGIPEDQIAVAVRLVYCCCGCTAIADTEFAVYVFERRLI
jgi:hypothetical protein